MFAALFYGLPIAALAWFVYSLGRYLTAKKDGGHDEKDLRRFRWTAILSGVIAGVLLSVVIGFLVLIGISIAYM